MIMMIFKIYKSESAKLVEKKEKALCCVHHQCVRNLYTTQSVDVDDIEFNF